MRTHVDSQQLVLPSSIISTFDVARVLSELEHLDDMLTTNRVRRHIGSRSITMPPLSEQLSDVLEQNELTLSKSASRSALLRQFRTLKNQAPIIHMTFAVEADRESLGQIVQWLRQEVHPQVVIAVGLQPALVAGVYVRTTNRILDLSLRGALRNGRAILAREIGALHESVA